LKLTPDRQRETLVQQLIETGCGISMWHAPEAKEIRSKLDGLARAMKVKLPKGWDVLPAPSTPVITATFLASSPFGRVTEMRLGPARSCRT
jgi:hypothetical protein